MREDLKDLWDYYLFEVPLKETKEDKRIKEACAVAENTLRENLNTVQIALLEEYDNATFSLGEVKERNAFIKGVMFTIRFIFQALYDD